jgi:hypothetical protein
MANTLRFKRGLVATIPTAVAGEPLFTTDTFDLYIGNGTNNTRFQKYIASGTTSQLLRGDGSLLTMPIVLTSPSNGQVLKYNGTNWVNDSDAGVTGSGTTNYIPKWTSGTAIGNSLVYDDGTNVGIGITNPVNNLTIYNATNTVLTVANGVVPNGTNTGGVVQLFLGGTGSATGNYAFTNDILGKVSFFGYGNNFLYEGAIINSVVTTGGNLDREDHKTALDFYTKTSGLNIPTLRMRLDASGNLGLGVTPSAWNNTTKALQINGGSIYAGNTFTFVGSNAVYTNSGDQYINTGFATVYGQLSGEHRWYNAPSGTAGNAISFTQAMTLDASGRLGIGTTSPSYPLQVRRAGGAGSLGISIDNVGSTDRVVQYFSIQDSATGVGAGHAFYYRPASSTTDTFGFILDEGGNVGIGTTSPASKFQIGSVGSTGYSISNGLAFGNGTQASALDVDASGLNIYSTNNIIFSPNTTERMRITSGGNVAIGSTNADPLSLGRDRNLAIVTTGTNAALTIVGGGAGRIDFGVGSTRTAGIYSDVSNYTEIFTSTSLPLVFSTNFTERMRIASGGNVGIGTTSPSYPLEIASTNALSIAYQRTGVAAKKWGFQSDNDSTYWYNITDNVLALTVRNTGIIGIGTTSPAAKLHLVDSVESEIRTQYSTTSSGKLITGNGFTTIGSITNDPLVFVSNNTERMRFTNGGNLLLGSTSDTGEKFQLTGAGIVSGLFTVSGSTGIPATTATYIRFASGFSSPDIGRMYIGDGSGWKFHMSKRLSSTTTDLITFFDNGSVQTSAPTGYAAKPYKLGEVLDGAVTIPTKSVAVEIDGTVYFLLASTTLP